MPIDFRAAQIQGNKLIASGSTGTPTGAKLLIYPHEADDAISPNQGFIDQSVFNTGSIGTDIFLYVSGGIGKKNVGSSQAITVFGGDVHISGNLTVDGTYPASGGGGGGNSSTGFYRMEVLDYAAVNSTGSTAVGQVIFPANQFTGSIVLYGVIANQLSTATGSVQLYNVTSGSYVEIGGAGITHIAVSGTVPTIITSVDLISASNFNSSSQAIYELQVSSSNGASYAFFGGFELRPSGSFSGVYYVTSSFVYVSGTWEDGGDKLATTASVALAGNLGTGYFADNVGSDVYFFVSGNNGGVDAGDGVSVFGGDVVMSGTLFGGSPLKIGTRINVNGAYNGDNNGNVIEFDNSSSIGGKIQTANNTDISSIGQGNLNITINAGNDDVDGPGGNLEINGGAGADSAIGNGWYSGDVIINGRVGGGGLSDGVSLYYGGAGGNIYLNPGPGGAGGQGGYGGAINLNGGQGGNGNDAASSGGDGGVISLYAGNGGVGNDIGGLGGDISIYAGNGEGGFFTPNISGSKGGSMYLSPGLGGITNGAPAGNGGDITIGAGPAGLDLTTYPASYEFTGSGRMYILGGTNGKDRVHISGSELTIGSDFNISQPTFTQKFKRVFINRAADEERAATTGEPPPSEIPDVFFYVSGGIGQKDGGVPVVALFGGDVVISGVLHGGSPLKIGSSILQNPNNNSIDAGDYNVILASDTNSYITGANAARNSIIGASTVGIEGESNYANRNTVLSSDTVSITTNYDDANFNSINASNGIFIDGSGGSSVNSGYFILIESASYANSVNSSFTITVTSASLLNGTLAAGDATNLFSPTISVIENSWGSAIIAGGPNVISSSDGTPIINSAIVGSNWVITSSRTYAIGDTVYPATVLISASNGVSITGDTNVIGNFTVNGSPVGGGGGGGTLQQAYLSGSTININELTQSINIIGHNYYVPTPYDGPLMKLVPSYFSYGQPTLVVRNDQNTTDLIQLVGNTSGFGGGQVLFKAQSWDTGIYWSTENNINKNTGNRATIHYDKNGWSLGGLILEDQLGNNAGSPGRVIIGDLGGYGASPLAYFQNATSSLGGDIYLLPSKTKGIVHNAGILEQNGIAKFSAGLSGSLTQLTDGSSYIIAGPGVVVSSASNGSITISAAGGSGLATGKQYLASATTTTTTTPLMIGQFSWVPADYIGLTSVRVRAIMSTDGTANHTGSLQIYNLTSGSYLDLIDMPSIDQYFIVTGSTPTLVTSSNLLSGITNFDNSSTAVYEIRVSGSSANNTIIGGVELIFS